VKSASRRREKSFRILIILDQPSDLPEQYRAIGWARPRLYTVIFEVREDEEGECFHLVTLWRATRQEQQLYEENS
jgi:uncharacterized DUF497 family protein